MIKDPFTDNEIALERRGSLESELEDFHGL